ncbi:MAG TPA: methylenetetrahydrofolate--tRNA-(uracil(54)-C(5))-methyltransferase (FADH(2)-oxidizing) TrmFO, partial [Erythrobacter sp.]|nr:methylenetetrahydrofolate--tRNA-(uracil(54)-C(5))-methyltransferase (FADH(2)-oxidizing) TrmFO [Erythrobacter sp.]
MTANATIHDVHIIGGGLAGSEAAWQLAQRGLRVRLSEMRGGGDMTPAHQTDGLAEMVCSNSFRSDDDTKNAVGLLHHEMRMLDSLIMRAGEVARVPAGSAMAVDRDVFSAEVEKALASHPNVTIVRERVDALPPAGLTIVATGPLTAEALAGSIVRATGAERLAFFDAIAPIIHHDSIDMSKCWIQSRWNKTNAASNEGGDYINCPMDEAQYRAFVQGLLDGEKSEFKQWEKDTPYFDGCMPIEVMAERGWETLRYGPMKGVGLDNPFDVTPEFPQGRWPYAVVQLRQDNKLGTLWNMVGFQTKLKYGAQVELFRTITGLENAEFARLGGLHRNTFLNSPEVLDRQLRLKAAPHIRFAGQVTGCEGYVESAAIGLIAGMMTAAELAGRDWRPIPATT